MKKKKVYLHIGYPKTGTTTLQAHFFPKIEDIQYLGANIDKNNFLHFEFSRTILDELIYKKENEINLEKIKKLFEDLMVGDKIILSAEPILSNSLRTRRITEAEPNDIPSPFDVARNFSSLFCKDKYDVKIIIAIRRQDEMITSLYAQFFAHDFSHVREYNTFSKYLDIFFDEEKSSHIFKKTLNYWEVISDYRSLFGPENVEVLVFESLKESPEKYYEDLCNILEISIPKYRDIAIDKIENQKNTGKNYKKTERLNLLEYLIFIKHKYFPFVRIKPTARQEKFLKSIVLFQNSKIEKTISLTDEQRKKILLEYESSNKKLSKEFGLNLERYGYFDSTE